MRGYPGRWDRWGERSHMPEGLFAESDLLSVSRMLPGQQHRARSRQKSAGQCLADNVCIAVSWSQPDGVRETAGHIFVRSVDLLLRGGQAWRALACRPESGDGCPERWTFASFLAMFSAFLLAASCSYPLLSVWLVCSLQRKGHEGAQHVDRMDREPLRVLRHTRYVTLPSSPANCDLLQPTFRTFSQTETSPRMVALPIF